MGDALSLPFIVSCLIRMPKVQEIFTTVAIMCHRYESLAVLPSVLAIILV